MYDEENAKEGREHMSCYGKFYGEEGTETCYDGVSGLCSYCNECQQDDLHY